MRADSTTAGINYVDSGGFVGTLSQSNIKNCESSGSIENKREWVNTKDANPSHTIAGFVGSTSYTTISNSNSYTDVKAKDDYIGGFVGCVNNTITVNNCNSYGSLSTGSTEIGGFIGHDIKAAGIYNNCYTNDTKHNFCYDRTDLTSSTETKNTVTVTPPTISTTETLPNRDAPTELYNLIASGNYYINDHAGNAADGFEDNSNWLTNMLSEGYLYLFKKDPEDGSFYQTNVATDTGLQEVSNTEDVKKAEATYENDMKKINRKETKIDTELQQLEAERTSVKTEQDSLKQVIKDNISLTFKLFS